MHVRPAGETFAVARDGKGLNELLERLRSIAPRLIAIEACRTIVPPLEPVNPAMPEHVAACIRKHEI